MRSILQNPSSSGTNSHSGNNTPEFTGGNKEVSTIKPPADVSVGDPEGLNDATESADEADKQGVSAAAGGAAAAVAEAVTGCSPANGPQLKLMVEGQVPAICAAVAYIHP